MIVFLTLVYVALLAILVKLKIVPLNTFWKLSPLLWMVLLFFVLFLPMQWGAPAAVENEPGSPLSKPAALCSSPGSTRLTCVTSNPGKRLKWS